MDLKSVGFIGGGRITRILLRAFENAGIRFSIVSVYDNNETVLTALKSDFKGIRISGNDCTEAASSDMVFLAVHPPVLIEVLQMIRTHIKKTSLVVSLAPKITLEKISGVLPGIDNIARMNPNAGTYINKGYNPVCFSQSTTKIMMTDLINIFKEVGKVPVVEESTIEGFAVISAMGHTYFWFQLQELKELALTFGLTEAEAHDSIKVMMEGTVGTLFDSGLSYPEVVNLVPVKPMADVEKTVKDFYNNYLTAIFQKIRP